MGFGSCKPPEDPNNTNTPTAAENVVAFVQHRLVECTNQIIALELIIEPVGGTQDTTLAREAWTKARKAYEMARFAIAQFDPVDHRTAAAWHSTAPKSGFHYLEREFFVPHPKMGTYEPDCETIYFCTSAYIKNKMDVAGLVTDAGIFQGLQYMLADIDSLKLSGLDIQYANNSVADAINNLDGMDSVYAYYKVKVQTASPSADTLFVNRLSSARTMLQTAVTLPNLDKASFRTNELIPLQSALKTVANALDITL